MKFDYPEGATPLDPDEAHVTDGNNDEIQP